MLRACPAVAHGAVEPFDHSFGLASIWPCPTVLDRPDYRGSLDEYKLRLDSWDETPFLDAPYTVFMTQQLYDIGGFQ